MSTPTTPPLSPNIIINILENNSFWNWDEVPIHINNNINGNINDLIESINNLKNYDLTNFSTDLKLTIYNNDTTRTLKINKVILKWNIPDNISEICFMAPIQTELFSIEKLNYNGLFSWKISSPEFNISNSTINSLKIELLSDTMLEIKVNDIKNLNINSSKDKHHSFYINLNKLGNLSIDNWNIKYLQFLDNQIINLELFNIKSNNILIRNNTWFDKIILSGYEFKVWEFDKNHWKELKLIKTNITECNFNNNYINDIILNEVSSISWEKSKIDVIYDWDFNSYQHTSIMFDNVDIHNIDIKSSDVKLNNSKYLSISFKNCKFREDWYYYIQKLWLDNLEFFNSTNLSQIFKLVNLDINNLYIDDYDFGKTVLNQIVINEKLSLYSPIFKDCIFNNVDFTKIKYHIELCNGNDLNKVQKHTELKDYYRQLKYVMDQNGNYTEWNHFFAKEMDEYWKTLNNKIDNIVYSVQKIISNFWNNWINSFLLLIWLWILATICDLFSIDAIIQKVDIFKTDSCINNIYLATLVILYDWVHSIFFLFLYHFITPDNITLVLDTFAKNVNPLQNLSDGEITFRTLTYKIIIWILIYHLFISLKRMTKR